jgi:hypothetical protein
LGFVPSFRLICISHQCLLLESQMRMFGDCFVHILYRTNQLEARELLENYQRGNPLLCVEPGAK